MREEKNRIIFFGTSGFAVPTLEALAKEGYEIVAIITNPDEPVGRKKILAPPPVKTTAERLGLAAIQPEKLRNNPVIVHQLSALSPSLGIIAAYGKIIPAEIINLFPFGILNIHPSLLPKYRGPTPIQSAILNGEKETGVTIIKIDEEADRGDIISKFQTPISNKDNYKSLESKLAKLGAELLIKILPDYLAGKIKPQPQDHPRATFTRKFTREDARIDWDKTAEEIDCQIRALNPEPGVWTLWNGKALKILEAEVADGGKKEAGRVLKEEGNIITGAARGSIVPKLIQLEGKKAVSVEDFARGNPGFIGAVLK